MVQWKVKMKKKWRQKIVGDARTRTRDLEVGSQVRYRYTKTFPIEITRKRKTELSNPTLQVRYEHDPGIWSKNKGHTCDSLLSQLQHTQSSAKTKLKRRRYCSQKTGCRIQFWEKVMSYREYTQNVKNWHATFNRKNTPWYLCQNEILWRLHL